MATNKATATFTNGVLSVRTGVNKTIAAGTRVRDSKTGTMVNFVGQVKDRSAAKHPFAFLDVEANELRRHSADYVAKYIA